MTNNKKSKVYTSSLLQLKGDSPWSLFSYITSLTRSFYFIFHVLMFYVKRLYLGLEYIFSYKGFLCRFGLSNFMSVIIREQKGLRKRDYLEKSLGVLNKISGNQFLHGMIPWVSVDTLHVSNMGACNKRSNAKEMQGANEICSDFTTGMFQYSGSYLNYTLIKKCGKVDVKLTGQTKKEELNVDFLFLRCIYHCY